jgi:hypothetical protein
MCRSRDSPGHCHAWGADRRHLQGVLTGVVPIREYFTPGNLLKIIGVRGMSKVLLNKFRVPHPRATPHRERVAHARSPFVQILDFGGHSQVGVTRWIRPHYNGAER